MFAVRDVTTSASTPGRSKLFYGVTVRVSILTGVGGGRDIDHRTIRSRVLPATGASVTIDHHLNLVAVRSRFPQRAGCPDRRAAPGTPARPRRSVIFVRGDSWTELQPVPVENGFRGSLQTVRASFKRWYHVVSQCRVLTRRETETYDDFSTVVRVGE